MNNFSPEDVAEIKAAFAQKHPGWTIHHTDQGRWWARRGVIVIPEPFDPLFRTADDLSAAISDVEAERKPTP